MKGIRFSLMSVLSGLVAAPASPRVGSTYGLSLVWIGIRHVCGSMMNVSVNRRWAQIRAELEQAQKARIEGNEGRARVCARRAAGWAVATYRAHTTSLSTHSNAYHHLLWLRSQESVPIDLRAAAVRLTVRVGKDYHLPHSHDPLQDAGMIVKWLSDEVE